MDISVVIPYYKAGRFNDSIVSCLTLQTCQDFDVIIVDDGLGEGIDDLLSKLKENKFDNNRLNVITTSGGTGPGNARNFGLKLSSSTYIAFLDADDWWPSNYIETSVHLIKKSDFGLIAYSSKYYDDKGNNVCQTTLPDKINHGDLLQTNPLSLPGVIIDRSRTGDFLFCEEGHEDLALWLWLTKDGAFFNCFNSLSVNIRRVGNSYSSNKFLAAVWHWRVIGKFSNFSFFKRIICFSVYVYNALIKRKAGIYKPFTFSF